MTHKRKSRYALFFLVLVGIASIIGYQQTYKEGSSKTLPDQAPAWKLRNMKGNAYTSEAFAGDVLIVNFCTLWNPEFRKTSEDLILLQNSYREQGLRVIGISLDENEPAKISAFAQSLGINYLLLQGNAEVIEAFGGVNTVPLTFIIDRTGHIEKVFPGVLVKEEVESLIQGLL